jgi:secreted trypsin-like serine protease
MKRPIVAALTAAASMGLFACEKAPTSADIADGPSFITNGKVAGDAYPAVVLIIMDVEGVPTYRCSGTLISPTIVLTAGHCVGEPGEFSGIRIFTESDVQNGDNNYPFSGPNSIEAVSWEAHPEYTNEAFYLHDVGMIELATPYILDPGEYGTLPTVNQLDALQPGSRTWFTSVGYGRQRSKPNHLLAERIRMVATPRLVQINSVLTGSYSLLLSTNAATGGTCFGDSGGPNYLGDTNVIAGVTSYGRNQLCVAGGGTFRLDRQDVLDFITGFIATHS